MRRSLTLVVILLLALSAAVAAPPANLQAAIEQLIAPVLADTDFQHARLGIEIDSLDDHTTWYARAAHELFIPASTTKIATTALALQVLTPDYRFTTRLLSDRRLSKGDLGVERTNLILQGGGDPLFSFADLRALAHQCALGDVGGDLPPLFLVNGHVRVDDSCFPARGPLYGEGWSAEDLPWYYAAPASALCCNENAVAVSVRGTIPGMPAVVELIPETDLLQISNTTVTTDATTGDNDCGIVPLGYQITVQGKVPAGKEVLAMVSMPDPDRFVLEQFAADLQAEGITLRVCPPPDERATLTVRPLEPHENLTGATGDSMPGDLTPPALQITLRLAPFDMAPDRALASHISPRLRDVIRPMLKNSDNHMAEQLRWSLLAHLGIHEQFGPHYAALLADLCRQARLPLGEVHLVDGCGLSRLNRLSPYAMTQLLAYFSASPFADMFKDALPVAGVDGTLKDRMIGTPAANDAHAKTGTMTGICTLAGYVTTQGGEHLVFTIFINDYQGHASKPRALQDTLVGYLAGLRPEF